MTDTIDQKKEIIARFMKNIKGKKPDILEIEKRHDGDVGHWLESQFGILHNADNAPDIYGYELKTQTSSKITFGDWSANEYVFMKKEYNHIFKGSNKKDRQGEFLKIFGKPNVNKNGRYSWSGEPCPKINDYNKFGQKLIVESNEDIVAIYDFEKDQREEKESIVPSEFHSGKVEIARWFGRQAPITAPKKGSKCLKEKLEDKFNQNGWFTCKRDEDGVYQKIEFGKPINFDMWIEWVKTGRVFFDSGMYEGNARPYAQWRMNNKGWDELIIDSYE